jgi:hypothetical protein
VLLLVLFEAEKKKTKNRLKSDRLDAQLDALNDASQSSSPSTDAHNILSVYSSLSKLAEFQRLPLITQLRPSTLSNLVKLAHQVEPTTVLSGLVRDLERLEHVDDLRFKEIEVNGLCALLPLLPGDPRAVGWLERLQYLEGDETGVVGYAREFAPTILEAVLASPTGPGQGQAVLPPPDKLEWLWSAVEVDALDNGLLVQHSRAARLAFRLVAKLITDPRQTSPELVFHLLDLLASSGIFDGLADYPTVLKATPLDVGDVLRLLITAVTRRNMYSESIDFLQALGPYVSSPVSTADTALFRSTLLSVLASERRSFLYKVAHFLKGQADTDRPWQETVSNSDIIGRFFDVALTLGEEEAAGIVYEALSAGRSRASHIVAMFEYYAKRAFPLYVEDATTREQEERARRMFERLCDTMGLNEDSQGGDRFMSFPTHLATRVLAELCVFERGQEKRARRVYEYLRKRKTTSTKSTDSAPFRLPAKAMLDLVTAYCSSDPEFAWSVISHFIESRARPSDYVYDRRRLGKPTYLATGFDNFDLTHVDCSSLVQAFFKLGDQYSALNIYRYMLKRKFVPDVVDMNLALLGMFEREPRRALDTLDALIEAGFKPSAATLSNLIAAARQDARGGRTPPLTSSSSSPSSPSPSPSAIGENSKEEASASTRQQFAAEVEDRLLAIAHKCKVRFDEDMRDMLVRTDWRSPMYYRLAKVKGMVGWWDMQKTDKVTDTADADDADEGVSSSSSGRKRRIEGVGVVGVEGEGRPPVRRSLVKQLLSESTSRADTNTVRRWIKLAAAYKIPLDEDVVRDVVKMCEAAWGRMHTSTQPRRFKVDLIKTVGHVLHRLPPPRELETYKALVGCCRTMGRVHMAALAHDAMVQAGVRPDEELASTVRDWLSSTEAKSFPPPLPKLDERAAVFSGVEEPAMSWEERLSGFLEVPHSPPPSTSSSESSGDSDAERQQEDI